MCCLEGKRYKLYVGCIIDFLCMDFCLFMFVGFGLCDLCFIFGVFEKFEQYVLGYGWILMLCVLGIQYNLFECGCIINVFV